MLKMKKSKVRDPIISQYKLERIQIDLVDIRCYAQHNDDYNWILNIIDHFTCYAWSFALKRKLAEDIASALLLWLEFNCPSMFMQSDEGGEFVNGVISILSGSYNITNITGGPYNPSINGKVERANQTLKRLLSKYYII